jgi:hypothetical protein
MNRCRIGFSYKGLIYFSIVRGPEKSWRLRIPACDDFCGMFPKVSKVAVSFGLIWIKNGYFWLGADVFSFCVSELKDRTQERPYK